MEIPPIVLAPLAGGPSTPELTAAAASAGAFAFLAGGYLSAAELEQRIARTRELTSAPFGVNLFVVEEPEVDESVVGAYVEQLAREGFEVGEPRFDDDALEEKIDVVARAGVPVVSTTFGPPPSVLVERVPQVWATVTSVDEARAARDAGASALVLQGAEAGGHRGSWTDADGPDLALHELVRGVDVGLPLVGAGGVATRDDVVALLEAGAVAAQAGTAFLLCPEAGTSEPHRRALAAGGETATTRAFTGRRARGIVNAFMRAHPDAPSAYPHIHYATAPFRAKARAAGDADAINLWAGTSFAKVEPLPAAEVVARLRP
jgi:nitronate monooxygenase